jgi:hypothetical protein
MLFYQAFSLRLGALGHALAPIAIPDIPRAALGQTGEQDLAGAQMA